MSQALLRRNSSKQGLQNLMRLTAQRSIEDAEELERERRRRARDASRWTNGETPADDHEYDGELKPGVSPSLDEDEGFSDWTQRRERQRQQRMLELNQGGEEDEDEEENTLNKTTKTVVKSSRVQREEAQEESPVQRMRRQKEEEEETRRRREELQRPRTEVEKRKDVKMSFTSKVFLHQEPKHGDANEDTTEQEVMSYTNHKTKRSTRSTEPEEPAILETEQRLEKIRQGLQQKESQELEQLRHRQAEAEQELEELKKRREERRRVREEEERRRDEEEQQRQAKEEEERTRMKKDMEKRRMEAAERMKSLSLSSGDGDEASGPFSPTASTHKISDRTESLNRSLKKSNSFKKTLVLLPRIDDKMEQYAHAVENSQEPRSVKAAPSDLHQSPEVVSSKKNLFEAGDAWIQSPSRGATCKDAEALKVGVADLITQWVKGPTDGRQSTNRPADVKPGDVMQKKNMWEGIGVGDSSRASGPRSKSSCGKKYKFVVTGHGKYEKIPVDDEVRGEFTNGKSDFYADY